MASIEGNSDGLVQASNQMNFHAGARGRGARFR